MRLIYGLLGVLISINLKGQYTVLGTATAYSGCNCYKLTNNTTNQSGAVFQNNSLNLSQSFDYTFSVFFGCGNGSGADGMCFVLTTNPNGLGTTGSGMGYGFSGVGTNTQQRSLAIEFDTYHNGDGADATTPMTPHIAFESGGSVNHNVAGPVSATPTANQPIDNCASHTVRIVWDVVTSTYAVYLDGNLRLSTVINNISYTYFGGASTVYWGWTGATGAITNEQRVCVESSSNWQAGTNYQNCGLTVQFSDNSTSSLGNLHSWAWDYGDGTADTFFVQQNPTHTYATSGTYTATLVITDNTGCTNSYTHTVVVAQPLALTPTIVNPDCGQSNGSITIVSTGGTGTNTYSWSPASLGNTATATGLAAAQPYSVTVTSGVCTASAQYTLTYNTTISATSSHTNVTCNGANNGTITLSISGGVPPFSFLGNPILNDGSSTINNLSPNTYSDTLTDAVGCKIPLSEVITEPTAVVFTYSVQNLVCPKDSNGSINLNVSGGNPPYTYSWNPAGSGNNLTNLSTGTYSFTITDAAGCTKDSSLTLISAYNAQSLGNTNLPDTSIICTGTAASLTLDATTANATSYLWSSGENTPSVLVTANNNLTVTVSNVCYSKTQSAVVFFETCDCDFKLPSAFTPNGDNINDVYSPAIKCGVISSYAMRIYNRWGEKMFESNAQNIGWDGKYKGEAQPTDTYVVYVDIEYKTVADTHKISKMSSITLLR